MLEDALAPFVTALQADGYDAVITEESGVITFEITAGPDACEDCLSPRTIMEPMITGSLRAAGLAHVLDLKYPAEK